MIKPTKKTEIKRDWHVIDAKNQVVGRLATRIAPLLMGKSKPYFVRNLDCGDFVVVVNGRDVLATGKKEMQKKYYSYSGYPGGLKETTLAQMRQKFPERIIKRAVSNMLPKNKLRPLWLKKLHVFAGSEHNFQDKFETKAKENVTKEGKKEES